MPKKRISAKQKAKQLAKYLRPERPDYSYLKEIFRHLRKELDIKVTLTPKKLPYVPTEKEINHYYEAVWQTCNTQHMVMIKTLLYTGVRVSELINIKIRDLDFDRCQIRINKGKSNKDRIVPFLRAFKEILAIHAKNLQQSGAAYLFESSWKRKYSDRGIRKILAHYTNLADMEKSISPHKLRHFLFTWLKKQGIDDALIQPYSGHESRQSRGLFQTLN